MTRFGSLVALGCILACGCGSEPTAPKPPNLAGQWYLVLSLSGAAQADSATSTCLGVLELTLTQTDSLLSGPYTFSQGGLGCQDRASIPGLFEYGFPDPQTFSGVVSATGDLRLGTGIYPDSIALVGRASGDLWGGTASDNVRFWPNGDTTLVLIPVTGTFTLVRPQSALSALLSQRLQRRARPRDARLTLRDKAGWWFLAGSQPARR